MNSPQIVIEPGRLARQYWRDLWRYRELLYFLAWRDVIVHYKQTVLGALWALIRPLSSVVVLVIVFGRLAKLESDSNVPYPLMVLAGMLPWQMFANALSQSSNSLLSNANLISKVYFPRLIIPLATVAVSFVDFLISSLALAAMMGYYMYKGDFHGPTWHIVTLPLFLLLAAAAAVGAGLWLGALSVRYRDVRHIVPYIVQLGMFVSPVGYRSSVVSAEYRHLYSLNPLVGVIDGFRWALLGSGPPLNLTDLALSSALVLLLLVGGVWYFRRTERTFADVI
jgi:lipopolysaccharide transport system permease protein